METPTQVTLHANESAADGAGATTTPSTVSRKTLLGTAAKAVAGAAVAGVGLPGATALAAGSRAHAPHFMRKGSQVSLSYFYGANPGEAKLRDQLFKQFEAANPDIKIVSQLAGASGLQKPNTEIAGGTPPDLMMGWELTYGDYAKRGVYMDLQPFIKNDPAFQSAVLPQEYKAVLDMFSFGGHLWVLPEQITNTVLFYNTDHMKQAGLTMPTSWDDATWTWDKFLGYAKKLTQTRGGRVTRYGYADMWWWPLTATNVVAAANGGDWFKNAVDPSAGSSNLSDPRIVQAVQWYADLSNVYKVAPTNQATTTTPTFTMFMNGKVSMGIVGHWFYGAFASVPGLNFDIAPIPIGPHGGAHSRTNIGGTGIAISSKTKYPEQCWRFAKFWAGQAGQQAIAKSGLWVPVLKNVGNSAAYKSAHPKMAHAGLFIDVLEKGYVHSLPISRAFNNFTTDYANVIVTDIFQNGKPAATELPLLDKKINASIKKFG